MSSIPSWAFKGAKVVCADASGQPQLQNGAIYTVAWAGLGDGMIDLGHGLQAPSVHLEGVERMFGVPFALSRFRPAVEPKSEAEDVALFKHHLDQRKPVDA